MTFDEFVAWLRSGFRQGNMRVRITSKQVLNDPSASTKWPLLYSMNGVLGIAKKPCADPSGNFVGRLLRADELTDQSTGLMRGVPSAGSGILSHDLDDSALMREVASIDWDGSLFEVRDGPDDSDWADIPTTFKGVILNGEANKQTRVMSYRADGMQYLLDERISTNAAGSGYFSDGRAAFGWCSKYPVFTDPDIADTSGDGDFYYYAVAFASEDKSAYMYKGDTATSNTDGSGSRVEANGSASWNGGSIPTDNVFIAAKGYNGGGFKEYAGEILIAAKSEVEVEVEPLTFESALQDLEFDTDSFDAYDLANARKTGFIFDNWKNLHGSSGTLQIRDDSPNTWREALEAIVGNMGGCVGFSREGKMTLSYLLDAPAGSPVLTLRRSDFGEFEYSLVPTIDRIELGMPNYWPTGDGDLVSRGESRLFRQSAADLKTVKFDCHCITVSDAESLGDDYLERFGERLYRFKDCAVAEALKKGDEVGFDVIDDHLGVVSLYGWVSGVGVALNSPWLEVIA